MGGIDSETPPLATKSLRLMGKDNSGDIENQFRIKVGEGSRVVLPSKIRKRLGWNEGDTLLLGRSVKGYSLTGSYDVFIILKQQDQQSRDAVRTVIDELAT